MENTASLGEGRAFSDEVTRALAVKGQAKPEAMSQGPVGRYAIGRRIGVGGMGEVFAAFDPTLQRTVALKLVKPRRGEDAMEAGARLRREAQALARLSHPNVVPVFDVGAYRDRIFIAMELVEGKTLTRWNKGRIRPWAEVLRVLLAAGHGLAAAHRAGVVHRDFKPSNVMVGEDGRARVLDFGLARDLVESADSLETPHRWARISGDSPRTDSDALTEAGVILGTPSYMAPEQFIDEGVDDRSDQFAFCVTAYRMLYGARPYEGDSFEELRKSVLRGQPCSPPRSSAVPEGVWRVLRRGLRRHAEDRYPDMPQLLTELAAGAVPRRGRWLAAGTGGLAVLLGSVVVIGGGIGGDDRCQAIALRASSTWGDAQRQAVRRSFEASEAPYAAAAWSEVDRYLSAYVDHWTEARQEVCFALVAGAGLAPTRIDRRITCLERHLTSAAALVDVLEAGGDPEVVENAAKALQELPPLASCVGAEQLPLPWEAIDPRVVVEVAAAQRQLEAIRATLLFHPDQSVLAVAEEVVRQAASLGHAPLVAEAQRVLGRAHRRERDYPAAKVAFDASIQGYAESGDIRSEVLSRLQLIDLLADPLVDPQEALRQARSAQALLERLGDPPGLSARLKDSTGHAYLDAGDLERAEALLLESLEVAETDPELASTRASARSGLATVFSRQGRYEDSVDLYDAEIAALDRLVGPDHPRMAKALGNLGSSLSQLGRLDEAEVAITRAIDIYTQAIGPDARGLEVLLHNLGILYQSKGDSERALDTLQRSIDLTLANRGPDHANLAWVRSDMGALLFMEGSVEEALVQLEEAVRIFEASQGEDAPGLVYSLGALIQGYLRLERPAEAMPHVERALGILERQTVDPAGAGMLRYSAALALWEAGEERERALALAREGLGDLGRSERKVGPQMETIASWIEEQEGALELE